MALSQIIRQACPVCGKIAVEKDRFKLFSDTQITLECGHLVYDLSIESKNYDITSSDGRRLMNYQIDGVKFAEAANGRVLIADEQGLGKTVQAAALLYAHRDELLPAVIVCPTTVKAQWFHELIRWMGHPLNNGPMTQVIQSTKEKAMSGFDIYIITYDMLKSEDMFSQVIIKTVIIDECQRIKNHLSDRAKACQRICREAEHIIALSGTPIKNNAGEYFTILNILQPKRFPTYQGYIDTYCDSYWSGYGNKIGGLKNPALFRDRTADFIIRRTKNEVLPDLPELTRKFYHVELSDKVKESYRNALKELDDIYYDDEADENTKSACILAIYSKMRYATGISKTTECEDFVTEFLLSCDRKIVIFTHHIDVMNLLDLKLSKWCTDGGYEKPLVLHSGLDGNDRESLVQAFKNGNSRIMIASTLAAGEGLNLQFCSDAVMLERQWNPANEEQAEGRFHRFGQINPVSVTYMLVSETIDEYFTELVEQKRSIFAATMDNKEIAWDQSSLMKELAGILLTKGRSKWKL